MNSLQKQCMAYAGHGPSVEAADKQEHVSLAEKQLPATSVHSHTGNQSAGAVRPPLLL